MLASEANVEIRKTDLMTGPGILSVLFSDANIFPTESGLRLCGGA